MPIKLTMTEGKPPSMPKAVLYNKESLARSSLMMALSLTSPEFGKPRMKFCMKFQPV